jgi:hypothetical protein
MIIEQSSFNIWYDRRIGRDRSLRRLASRRAMTHPVDRTKNATWENVCRPHSKD